MDLEKQIKFLNNNKDSINFSGIAKQLSMDASNFHKVLNGALKLNEDRQYKLREIIRKLSIKNTL